MQAQQLWLTGIVAPWHVGSSQTRARTRGPCIGRQILNCCTTREARKYLLLVFSTRLSFFFLKINLLIYLFIGCVGSSFLCAGFL